VYRYTSRWYIYACKETGRVFDDGAFMQVREVGELTKRLTLIISDGKIVECFYPVFPSDSDTGKVFAILRQQQAQGCTRSTQ